jgi:hypothetical protein
MTYLHGIKPPNYGASSDKFDTGWIASPLEDLTCKGSRSLLFDLETPFDIRGSRPLSLMTNWPGLYLYNLISFTYTFRE